MGHPSIPSGAKAPSLGCPMRPKAEALGYLFAGVSDKCNGNGKNKCNGNGRFLRFAAE
jgi:hypothetical protein